MQSTLLIAATVVMFGVMVGVSLWFALRRIKQAGDRLQELGDRLGLQLQHKPKSLGFIPQVPEVEGRYRGKHLRLYAYSTGSGKSRTHYAAVAVTPAQATGLTFELSREGLGSKLRSLFGAKEIQVGDPEFDRRWFIQTNAPVFLQAALIPELRARLDAVAKRSKSGRYETIDGAIRYAEVGWFDADRCRRYGEVVEAVCDLADVAEVYGVRRAQRPDAPTTR